MPLEVGQILKGTISSITNFGAFVKLPDNATGMVHISEIADTYVRDIHEHIALGQEVDVKVIGIDANGRVSLSVKKAQAKSAPPPVQPQWQPPSRSAPPSDLFEDMLGRFMKDSEERLLDVKRNKEHKRSGGYSRGR